MLTSKPELRLKKVLGLRNGGGKLIFHHLVGGELLFFWLIFYQIPRVK